MPGAGERGGGGGLAAGVRGMRAAVPPPAHQVGVCEPEGGQQRRRGVKRVVAASCVGVDGGCRIKLSA